MPYRFFEVQADRTLLELTVVGEYAGGPLVQLQPSVVGPPEPPEVPLAPAISAGLLTRTTSRVDWVAPDNTGRPRITEYRIYRDGVLVGTVDDLLRTFTETGLPTATPERIFAYTVRAVNDDGVGALSNQVTVQWNVVVANPPTAVGNLTRTTLTSTSVQLSWSETADATVDRHGIYEADTLVRDNVGDAVTKDFLWTGLVAGSAHSQVNVRRHNSAGWSPSSNTLSFTTPSSNPGTVTMLMGCSDPNPSSPWTGTAHGGTEDWEGWRCYRNSGLYARANATGVNRPLFLAYSEDGGVNLGGANPVYQTVYDHALDELNTFYYTTATGQTHSTRWGIKLYWSNGNENYDKGALGPSGRDTVGSAVNVPGFVTSMRALHTAVHYVDPTTGQRRFPDAYAGSNPVQDAERLGILAEYLHPSARYHDFIMWSMYPVGRKNTVSDPTYTFASLSETSRNTGEGYLLRAFYRTKQAEAQARIDTGNANLRIACSCGEIGTGDDPSDRDHRPYHACHSFAGGMTKLATQYDLDMPFACWWDDELAGGPQNILSDEPTATSPSTRVAWQSWRTYNHEFGGTHPANWPASPKSTWPTGA